MNQSLSQLLSAEEYESLHKSTAKAHGLPPRAYIDSEFWELEQEKIFNTGWNVCGFESDLPARKSVFPVSVCGLEVLLTRDGEGNIFAFHNVCRHRAIKVVSEPCSDLDKLVCPWHSWTYDLKGNLVATPHIGGKDNHIQGELDYKLLGLKPIRCSTWMGFIYINVDGNAAPLPEYFAAVDKTLSDYDFDLLRFEQTTEALEFECNWKLVVEGGVENYHLPWVHPETGGHSGISREESDENGGYIGMATLWERSDADEEDLLLPKFPHLENIQIKEGDSWEDYYLFAYPGTTIIEVMANHVVAVAVMPISVNKTVMRRSIYFVSDVAMTEKYAVIRKNIVRFWNRIGEQDRDLMTTVQVQQHQRVKAAIPTRFSSHWESAVHRFQKMIIEKLS